MTDDPPKPPDVLNRFVHLVLSYKPKPKSKPARKRKRAVCPECPVCGTYGDPNCYRESITVDRCHGQELADVQCQWNAFLLAAAEEERRYELWVGALVSTIVVCHLLGWW